MRYADRVVYAEVKAKGALMDVNSAAGRVYEGYVYMIRRGHARGGMNCTYPRPRR